MAYQIILKKRFINKVKKTLAYLEKEWSHKVACEFLEKIERRIELLSRQPHFGAPSGKIKDTRGLLISRHNKLYYKIKNNTVTILNFYDTRLGPKKNRYK